MHGTLGIRAQSTCDLVSHGCCAFHCQPLVAGLCDSPVFCYCHAALTLLPTCVVRFFDTHSHCKGKPRSSSLLCNREAPTRGNPPLAFDAARIIFYYAREARQKMPLWAAASKMAIKTLHARRRRPPRVALRKTEKWGISDFSNFH